MPRRHPDSIAVIGIGLGKNVFHLIGLNKRGAIVLRLKLSRSQLEPTCRPVLAWRPVSARTTWRVGLVALFHSPPRTDKV